MNETKVDSVKAIVKEKRNSLLCIIWGVVSISLVFLPYYFRHYNTGENSSFFSLMGGDAYLWVIGFLLLFLPFHLNFALPFSSITKGLAIAFGSVGGGLCILLCIVMLEFFNKASMGQASTMFPKLFGFIPILLMVLSFSISFIIVSAFSSNYVKVLFVSVLLGLVGMVYEFSVFIDGLEPIYYQPYVYFQAFIPLKHCVVFFFLMCITLYLFKYIQKIRLKAKN